MSNVLRLEQAVIAFRVVAFSNTNGRIALWYRSRLIRSTIVSEDFYSTKLSVLEILVRQILIDGFDIIGLEGWENAVTLFAYSKDVIVVMKQNIVGDATPRFHLSRSLRCA